MWIEKVAENGIDIQKLFEEFLNKETFDSIKVVGKQKIAGGEDVYVVKATQYVKDIEKTFYFGDFSVGVDMMENSYPRKQRDLLNDVAWTLVVASKLDEQDKKQYKAEAREYQLNKIKEELALVDEFYGKRKTTKSEDKKGNDLKDYQERQNKRREFMSEVETKADLLETKFVIELNKSIKKEDKDLEK